jgi:hypothetical protein
MTLVIPAFNEDNVCMCRGTETGNSSQGHDQILAHGANPEASGD